MNFIRECSVHIKLRVTVVNYKDEDLRDEKNRSKYSGQLEEECEEYSSKICIILYQYRKLQNRMFF